MRVLIIGGTGLISVGVVKHLLARGADVTVFNRGQRGTELPGAVKHLVGDRNEEAFESNFADKAFDVVIDMICFTPQQAEQNLRAFAGRCEHFIFCSTVCVYGSKLPPRALVDESFAPEPISEYGRNKLACETIFRRAEETRDLRVTIIRPSSTYGPGAALIDNLESDGPCWDRIERGLPVLCSGDGLGLWNSTHRDDVGKLFAFAAQNPKTFGKTYNATIDRAFTWRDYYREAAAALGKSANVIFAPADWILSRDTRNRFGLLKEITRFHGAYDSSAARRDVPEFTCEVGFAKGAAQTFADVKRRGAWKSSGGDAMYQSLVDAAVAAGMQPTTL